MKEQIIRTIDYTNVMYADFAIVVAVLITALLWAEQRWFLVGMGSVYLFATLGFHFDLLPTSN